MRYVPGVETWYISHEVKPFAVEVI